jgi:hypothetical protein
VKGRSLHSFYETEICDNVLLNHQLWIAYGVSGNCQERHVIYRAVVSDLSLYSGGTRFESRPRCRLSLESFMVFPSPFRQIMTVP